MEDARHKKLMPTTCTARLSFNSRRRMSASTDILHSKTDPDVTSMKLSIPKPTSEMLPAIAPATTATRPSNAFQAIVKYSSLRPCRTTAVRSKMAVSAISAVYNVARAKPCPGLARIRPCVLGNEYQTLGDRIRQEAHHASLLPFDPGSLAHLSACFRSVHLNGLTNFAGTSGGGPATAPRFADHHDRRAKSTDSSLSLARTRRGCGTCLAKNR